VTAQADKRTFIAGSKWFRDAPGEVLEQLAAAANIRHFTANSHIWLAGQEATHIYGVIDGRVRVYLSTETGQEFALVEWEAGAWLGEQALAGNKVHLLSVQVLDDSEILAIPCSVVTGIGETWPLLYRNLFQEDWENTRGLYEILTGLLFYPLRARVAGRLLLLMQDHGERVEDGIQLNIKISQNDFARLSMGSRQRVNTIFRDWAKQGLVKTRDDYLLVMDTKKLMAEMTPFE
jgi:CRP-like cAMP-binding protein